MAALEIELVPMLPPFAPQQWQHLTVDSPFASPAWYQLIQTQTKSLSQTLNGQADCQFLIVSLEQMPVVVWPLLRVRGADTYFIYNLQRYYFEHWLQELDHLDTPNQAKLKSYGKWVQRYRQFLTWSQAPLLDAWILTQPLSYRCQPNLCQLPANTQQFVLARTLAFLQRLARQTRAPLWLLGLAPTTAAKWEPSLTAAGLKKSFLFYDNVLELTGTRTFADYLHSFRRTTRRAFERDIKRTQAAGYEFTWTQSVDGYASQMTKLYQNTYGQYGDSYFRHNDDFWRNLTHCMGKASATVLAWHEQRLVGFSTTLVDGPADQSKEFWTYRIGRADASNLSKQSLPDRSTPQEQLPETKPTPWYFSLSFYEPIRRALELGAARIWFGPAGYPAKRVRGATPVPLYSYFWFPRPLDRFLLIPYLQLFGELTRKQLDHSFQVSVNAHPGQPENGSNKSSVSVSSRSKEESSPQIRAAKPARTAA